MKGENSDNVILTVLFHQAFLFLFLDTLYLHNKICIPTLLYIHDPFVKPLINTSYCQSVNQKAMFFINFIYKRW